MGVAGSAGFASRAWIARTDAGKSLDSTTDTVVGSINLPAGKYALFAKTVFYPGASDLGVTCKLSTGEEETLYTKAAQSAQVVLQDLLTLNAPGTATFTCSSGHLGSVEKSKLTAISVSDFG